MSDLREAIAQEVRIAYYRSLAAHELPCSDKQANVIGKISADAVLAVVTARVNTLRPSKDRFLSAYEEGRSDAIYDVLDVLGELK